MIIFIDLEASSLHDGYPIEVAWCAEDLSVGASYLIHPADWPHWLSWDPGAEALHGLSADALERDGRSSWLQRCSAICNRPRSWSRTAQDTTGVGCAG